MDASIPPGRTVLITDSQNDARALVRGALASQERRARAAGADAYLTRPFGVRRLADSVVALLDGGGG